MDDQAVRRIRARLTALERQKRAEWREYSRWLEGKNTPERKRKYSSSEIEEIPGLKAALVLLTSAGREVTSG